MALSHDSASQFPISSLSLVIKEAIKWRFEIYHNFLCNKRIKTPENLSKKLFGLLRRGFKEIYTHQESELSNVLEDTVWMCSNFIRATGFIRTKPRLEKIGLELNQLSLVNCIFMISENFSLEYC
ncbi:unnamed protein product [Moneuplotes crassus]|uniref:Uncharacterized protein n=1 Tax=Euplotes crassus TaxID=5936 RepID=A0AAD1XIY8_EUPCR|nr:unnamed protein product [Moneuplotes crassus]